jgi:Domain of unknown function (DUF397)
MSESVRHSMSTVGLVGGTWRKSRHSGPLGNCTEAAALDSGEVAMHNSHDPICVTDLQRCSGVLGHINGLAEDGEWHCHLPHGHDGVCLAPDGTTW